MGVSTKITQIRTDAGYAMTGNHCKGNRINLQEIFGANKNCLKELLREVLRPGAEGWGDADGCVGPWTQERWAVLAVVKSSSSMWGSSSLRNPNYELLR
jgi:hypothetical protein